MQLHILGYIHTMLCQLVIYAICTKTGAKVLSCCVQRKYSVHADVHNNLWLPAFCFAMQFSHLTAD